MLYVLIQVGNIKYNPIDKKELKSNIIANRLKEI